VGIAVVAVAVLAAGAGLLWPLRGLHVTAVSMSVVDGQVSVAVTVSEVPRRCTTRIAVLDTSVTAPWSGGTVHALLTPTVADADAGSAVPVVVTTGGCLRATRVRTTVRLHPSA
jgi:hypothetical protein